MGVKKGDRAWKLERRRSSSVHPVSATRGVAGAIVVRAEEVVLAVGRMLGGGGVNTCRGEGRIAFEKELNVFGVAIGMRGRIGRGFLRNRQRD